MTEILIAFGLLLLVAVIIMLAVLLKRQTTTDFSPLLTRLETLQTLQERTERGLKEEVSRNRHESGEQARGLREEVQGSSRIPQTRSFKAWLAFLRHNRRGLRTSLAN